MLRHKNGAGPTLGWWLSRGAMAAAVATALAIVGVAIASAAAVRGAPGVPGAETAPGPPAIQALGSGHAAAIAEERVGSPSLAGPPPTDRPGPLGNPQAKPGSPETSPEEICLRCHAIPGLAMSFPNGDAVPITISEDHFGASVHGAVLLCQDCHRGYEQLPHPEAGADGYRDYSIGQHELCKRCHFANYTKTLDSVHFQVLGAGNRNAPICTDCHGAHDVQSPNHPRSRMALACAQCHEEIYATYRSSVHGRALVDEENEDVPTCTYCHGVHSIHDPRTSSFRLEIPQLCGSCHADRERMAKYGLSTQVLSTYLSDFHGTTVTLAQKKNPDILSYEAVCTDCHGIHDITSTSSPGSPVIRANLAETCRQCHPGASANFPSAWVSHYVPSLHRAPLVFAVETFYRILIPTFLVGLSIHVALDLWRAAINR